LTSAEASTFAMTIDGTETATHTGTGSVAAADVAQKAQAEVAAAVTPAGCETSTISGSTDTFVFKDCTGPRDLVHATGVVTADYSIDAVGIHAQAVAGSFQLNQALLDLTANATYTSSAWTTTNSAGLARGTTVSSFTRCTGTGTCPQAGGTIAHTSVLGQTLTISYDGSTVAKWSSTSGKSGTVQSPAPRISRANKRGPR